MTADLEQIAGRLRAIEGTIPLLEAIRSVSEISFRRTGRIAEPMQTYAEQVDLLLKQAVDCLSDEALTALRKSTTGTGSAALLVISAERGLCGAFNSTLAARALAFVRQRSATAGETAVLCWGSRARRLIEAASQRVLYSASLASFALPSYEAVEAMTLEILALAEQREFESIMIMHNAPAHRFQYEVKLRQLLPPEIGPPAHNRPQIEIKPAGDAPTLAAHLLTEHVLIALYRAVIESALSEQLARIATMRLAVDNAQKLAQALGFEYTLARQREQTNALLEIVNGYRVMTEPPGSGR